MASVQQKVAAIKKKCAEVDSGARKIRANIRELERVNASAISHIHAEARKIVAAIRGQEKVNVAYIKDFYFG